MVIVHTGVSEHGKIQYNTTESRKMFLLYNFHILELWFLAFTLLVFFFFSIYCYTPKYQGELIADLAIIWFQLLPLI